MDTQGRVDFELPARAENVALVRHAIAGLAEVLGMGPAELADLKTVVTEACTNVVAHAYGEEDTGPLEVSAYPDGDGLTVTVRDYGLGIRPLADVERESLRLGLPLIAALSERFEVRANDAGGTTVTMRMPFRVDGNGPQTLTPVVADVTRIDIGVGEALAPVLSRVISMFATRADFTVDRLSDAILLSDAISAASPGPFPEGRARITVSESDGAFQILVGPLSEGGGDRLLAAMRIPQLDASLATLAEEVAVESGPEGEHLRVRIGASR